MRALIQKYSDLPKHLADAIAQTFFVLIFSFMPAMGISLKRYLETENQSFLNLFNAHFSKGEICFFILSVIGAIFWSIISRRYASFMKIALLGSIAIIMIITLIYVGDNSFPNEPLVGGSQKFLWAIYFFTLFVWFVSLFGEMQPRNTMSKEYREKSREDIHSLIQRGRASDG